MTNVPNLDDRASAALTRRLFRHSVAASLETKSNMGAPMGRHIIALSAVILCVLPAIVHGASAPTFSTYEAEAYNGPKAPLLFQSDKDRKYRTRLRKAYLSPVNFSGRYIFASWGTHQDSCRTGAVLDVSNGNIVFLPLMTCNWKGTADPFDYNKNSQLLVVSGQIGGEGENGLHYYVFDGKDFSPPNEVNSSEALSTDVNHDWAKSLPTSAEVESIKENLSKVLALAIYRPGFENPSETDSQVFSKDTLIAASGVLYKTSIRRKFEVSGVRYQLLYNWMADLFFLIKYEGNKIRSVGMMSGTLVSGDVYERTEPENYFDITLKQRPGLFKNFSHDLPLTPTFETPFSTYLWDQKESSLVKGNLLSFMKMMVWAGADPCKTYLQTYLRKAKLTFHGQSLSPGSDISLGIGFRSPEGRVLAFSDRKTNENMGFVVVEQRDETTCTPIRVLTSRFE